MKGHNQSDNKQSNPLPDKPKGKGQHEHLKKSAKKKESKGGRSEDEDPAKGKKGANSI
jgi:hypothetical protein